MYYRIINISITAKSFISYIQKHPAKAGTVAGWFQQACSAGVAILLIPILLRLLPTDQAGIWFSFQGFVGIANLADFGFGAAISRQVAFCAGQSTHVSRTGDFLPYGPGWEGIRNLMAHAKAIYRRVIVVSFLISAAIFELILPHTKLAGAVTEFRPLWYLMAATAAILLSLSRFNALLIGLNHVYLVRTLTGFYFLFQGAAVAVAAMTMRSLPAMAVASLSITAINWMLIHIIVHFIVDPSFRERTNCSLKSFPPLFRVAFPLGVVNLSAFLVSSIQVPLIGAVLGPASVAPFYLAQKLGQFINMIPLQIIQARLPGFTRLIAAAKQQSARRMMLNTIVLLASLTVTANVLFFTVSPVLARFLSGDTLYPTYDVIGIMALDYLLAALSVVWAQFVLASGRNPFVLSTLLCGIINLVLLFFLTRYIGLLGIPLSSLVAGLLTNYAYAPYKGFALQRQLQTASG